MSLTSLVSNKTVVVSLASLVALLGVIVVLWYLLWLVLKRNSVVKEFFDLDRKDKAR